MLASIKDYFFIWELPLFTLALFAWIFVGGVVFRRTIAPIYDRSNVPMKEGLIMSLLAGLAGTVTSICILYICSKIFRSHMLVGAIGAPLAIVTFVLTAWLTAYSKFKITASQAFAVALKPSLAILGAVAVVIVPTIYFAYTTRINNEQIRQQNAIAQDRLNTLATRLQEFTIPPRSLEEMIAVDRKKIKDPEKLERLNKLLVNPVNPDLKPGFFYVARDSFKNFTNEQQPIIVCEFPNTRETGQVYVAYLSRNLLKIVLLDPAGLAAKLKRPENEEYRKAFNKLKK